MTITPSDDIIAGGTYPFNLVIKKDGVAWNLAGATVNLILKRGRNTAVVHEATITNAAGGLASYTTTTEDLVAGEYTCSCEVRQGSIVVESEPTTFIVGKSNRG